MVAGLYGQGLGVGTGAMTSSVASDYFPAAKLGSGNYFMTQYGSGVNYFMLMGINSIVTPATGVVDVALGLTPMEAYNIDYKIDDGMPNTGRIITRGTAGQLGAVNPINGLGGYGGGTGWIATGSLASNSIACQTSTITFNDASNIYNLNAETGGNAKACQLLMQFN